MFTAQMMPALNLFYPLNEFYDEARLPRPTVTRVEAIEIPEPCRSILVHDLDMTPTLENTYGGAIDLRVLKHSLRDNVFSRQIVLTLRKGGVAVLFGAIKIYLDRFPEQARSLILEMKQPLGTILATQGIPHSSHPAGYFSVEADALINSALQLSDAATLYGRRNVLSDSSQRTLAEVLEILPPSDYIENLRSGLI
jgi:chorismate-pyruvate lyase